MARDRIFDDLDEMLDRIRRGARDEPGPAPSDARTPACDVFEEDGRYVVTVELPGFDEDGVRIEAEGDGIRLRAFPPRRDLKPGRFLRRERHGEAFERFVPMPGDASLAGLRKRFDRGLLVITVPRKPPAKRDR